MKIKMFNIYDQKAKSFLQPFFMQNNSLAVRAITDLANDPEHSFCRHAEDYTLYELGTFDDQDCSFDLHDAPLTICLINTLKESDNG
jgi:hypothetical protein